MIESSLSSGYKFRANIRPVRHCYLVSARSRSQIMQAMSYCCTQWGGIGNLIVPVTANLAITPLYEQLIRLVDPEVFVSYMPAASEKERARKDKLGALMSSLLPDRVIQVREAARFEELDRAAHPLSVLREEDQGRSFLDRRFQGPKEDRAALLALFGRVYPSQVDDYAQVLAYGVMPVGFDSQDFWSQQMSDETFSSPIRMTGHGVHAYKVEGGDLGRDTYHSIVVGDSNAGLCLFWNLRAISEDTRLRAAHRRPLLLMPMRLLREGEGLARLAEAIRRAPGLEGESNLDLAVYLADRSAFEAWTTAVASAADFAPVEGKVKITLPFSSSKVRTVGEQGPITYARLQIALPVSFHEGVHYETPPRISLSFGDNMIRIEPPPGYFKRFVGTQMLDLDCEVWERYPQRAEVAKAVHQNARFTHYGVSFTSDVWHRPSEFRFRLPTERETLAAVFRAAGLEVRDSDKTRYLEALVRLIGGFDRVEPLASAAAFSLMKALAMPPTERLAQRIVSQLALPSDRREEVANALQGSDIVVELSTGSKSLRQLSDGPLRKHRRDLLPLLAQLSTLHVVRRGFRLPCADCGLTTWHPLGTADESIECPGCDARFSLPVEHPVGSELQFHYALNSLVNRAWDQGALSALVAMHYLARERSGVYCRTAGLELVRDGELVGDIDFIMFTEGRLLAGEAKMGSILQEKDFHGAEVAEKAGVAEYSFCTTSSFADEALRGVEGLRAALAARGSTMSVNVLQGVDLLTGCS